MWPEKIGPQNGAPDKGISQESGVLEKSSECTARPLPYVFGLTNYRGGAKGKCLLIAHILHLSSLPVLPSSSNMLSGESRSPLSDR